MAFVYILQSRRDGRFYIGSTVDIKKRMRHHKGGFTPSTKRFGELDLVFSQKYTTLKEARRIERKLKNLKRKDYIEKIIKDGFIKMKAGD
ncbi:MAG: GIY-YIG nuclease family protein [Candidatus Parcubacteria bacterium]|nr:GIY-YIG nuclease family protein [Candidatus Parcubacteria bacterium]